MSEITLIVPNDWVAEDKLVEITGLRPGTIEAARKKSWMVGRGWLIHSTRLIISSIFVHIVS